MELQFGFQQISKSPSPVQFVFFDSFNSFPIHPEWAGGISNRTSLDILQYLTNKGKGAELDTLDQKSFVNEDINGLPHLVIAMGVNFLAHLPWFGFILLSHKLGSYFLKLYRYCRLLLLFL